MARFGQTFKAPSQKQAVTTVRGKRLTAWLFALVIASALMAFVFFPALMAFDAARNGDGDWLEGASLFVVMLPGLFTAILYFIPVWFVLRFWLARQPETDIGGKPATLPVWIAIWVIFAGLQLLVVGDGDLTPPPPPFDILPAPASVLFNGVILAKMAGITVMFLFYRQARPKPA